MMAFVQSIDFATEQRDEILEVMRRWSADAIGNGTAQRGSLAEDRAAPGRFVLAVWFESAEAAAENSDRPETGRFAEEFGSLCSDGPEFREFDVVEVYGE
jgi:quinol monooxygenase YgiN